MWATVTLRVHVIKNDEFFGGCLCAIDAIIAREFDKPKTMQAWGPCRSTALVNFLGHAHQIITTKITTEQY